MVSSWKDAFKVISKTQAYTENPILTLNKGHSVEFLLEGDPVFLSNKDKLTVHSNISIIEDGKKTEVKILSLNPTESESLIRLINLQGADKSLIVSFNETDRIFSAGTYVPSSAEGGKPLFRIKKCVDPFGGEFLSYPDALSSVEKALLNVDLKNYIPSWFLNMKF